MNGNDLLVRYDQEFLDKKSEGQLRAILHKGFGITRGVSRLSKEELIEMILEKHQEGQSDLEDNHNIDPELIVKNSEGKEFKAKFQPETEEVDECVIITDKEGDVSYELLDDYKANYTQMKYSTFSEDVVEEVSEDVEEEVEEEESVSTESVVEKKKFKTATSATNAYNRTVQESIQRFGYVDDQEEGYKKDEDEILETAKEAFKLEYGYNSLEEALAVFDAKEEVKEEKKVEPKPKTKKVASKSGGNTKTDRVKAIITEYLDKDKKFTSGVIMQQLEARHQETIHRSFCITIINKVKAERNV